MRTVRNSLNLVIAILALAGLACAAPAQSGPDGLLPNGVLLPDGTLVGGQPSPGQLQAIRDAGFRTVVNMRLVGRICKNL